MTKKITRPHKKVGRPSKKDSIHYEGVKLCYSKGFTDAETALALQITEETLNNWKKKDPEFFKSLKEWKAIADGKVETSLYKSACGYMGPDGKYYPPNSTSIIFWLTNRQKENWKHYRNTEHSGPGGGPIKIKQVYEFTDEDLSKIITESIEE